MHKPLESMRFGQTNNKIQHSKTHTLQQSKQQQRVFFLPSRRSSRAGCRTEQSEAARAESTRKQQSRIIADYTHTLPVLLISVDYAAYSFLPVP